MKQLWIAEIEVTETRYMSDVSKRVTTMAAAWADSESEAQELIEAAPEFANDEYSVYRSIQFNSIRKAAGTP